MEYKYKHSMIFSQITEKERFPAQPNIFNCRFLQTFHYFGLVDPIAFGFFFEPIVRIRNKVMYLGFRTINFNNLKSTNKEYWDKLIDINISLE